MKPFKPGDQVKFKGLTYQGITVGPVEGELVLIDLNTTKPGVMTIAGDLQRMMFLQDGTIYCHPKFGKVLTRKRKSSKI